MRVGEGEFRAQLAQQRRGAFGGSHRRRRFDDNQTSPFEHGGDRFERGFYGRDIGFVIVGDRRRHRNDKCVRRFGRRDRTQLAGFYRRTEHHIEVGLDDMRAARIDTVDRIAIDVYADDVKTSSGERRRGGESDIAEADDADGLNFCLLHINRSFTMRSLAWPSPKGFAPVAMAA